MTSNPTSDPTGNLSRLDGPPPVFWNYDVDGVTQVVVESFGYLHDPAPEAHVTLDVRQLLHNPHHDPAMRELTGLDTAVRDHVLATPGTTEVIGGLLHMTASVFAVQNPQHLLTRVAVGCAGGRHRSVALANEVGRLIREQRIGVCVTHRDVLRPVVRQQSGGAL